MVIIHVLLCRYDTRGEDKNYDEARHWSDDKVLTGRAFFRGDHDPGRLVLDSVAARDQGVYKCRVDFRQAPTRISNVKLNVIGNCIVHTSQSGDLIKKLLQLCKQTLYIGGDFIS